MPTSSSLTEKILIVVVALLVVAQGYTIYELKKGNVAPPRPGGDTVLPASDQVYPIASAVGSVKSTSENNLVVSTEVGDKTVVLTSETVIVKTSNVLKDEETSIAEVNAFNEKMASLKKASPEERERTPVIIPSPFIETKASRSDLVAGAQVSVLTDPDAQGTPVAYKIVITVK